ncbi:olfactory receptor 13D1-like [Mantella aurantiaca]
MALKNGTVIREFILLGLSSDPNIQIILFVVILIMYLIILVANSLIVLAVVTDSNLQTPMYFFLTNLSVLDILYTTSYIPRMLRDMLTVKKNILFTECVTQMYISLSLGMTEWIILAILDYNCYIAICYPLHYTSIFNRVLCIRIAAGTWMCAFLLSIVPVSLTLNGDFCGHQVINHFVCELTEVLSLECGSVTIVELLIFVNSIIILIAPIGFIILTYIKIIRAIFKISFSARRRKAFSTCGSHIVVVTLFHGSSMVTYMKPRSKASPDTDKLFAISYAIVTLLLNPLIYTLRNKDVKSALEKISRRGVLFPHGGVMMCVF